MPPGAPGAFSMRGATILVGQVVVDKLPHHPRRCRERATSVDTRMGNLPRLKLFMMVVRLLCGISPCSASTSYLLLQLAHYAPRHILGVGKDHHPAELIAVQQVAQALQLTARHNGVLRDGACPPGQFLHKSRWLPVDISRDICTSALVVVENITNWRGHGLDDAGHIFHKAHLEHFVTSSITMVCT